MKYMNPAVLCYGPYTLRAGASFTLRYRVLIRDGTWSAAELQHRYDEFTTERE
jgi:hypothetical protein